MGYCRKQKCHGTVGGKDLDSGGSDLGYPGCFTCSLTMKESPSRISSTGSEVGGVERRQ